MGIAQQKLKVMGMAQKQEGGMKAAFLQGCIGTAARGAARVREGALGTRDGMGQ